MKTVAKSVRYRWKVVLGLLVVCLVLLIVVTTPKYSYANAGEVVRSVFMVGDPPSLLKSDSLIVSLMNKCVDIKPGCESAFEKKYSAENYFDPILDTLTAEENACLLDGCNKKQMDAFDELAVVTQRVELTGDHLTQIAEAYVDTQGIADNLVLWVSDGFIYGSADNKAYGFPGKISVKAAQVGDSFEIVELFYGQVPLGGEFVRGVDELIKNELQKRIARLKIDYTIIAIGESSLTLEVTAPEGMITQENGELRLYNDKVQQVRDLAAF